MGNIVVVNSVNVRVVETERGKSLNLKTVRSRMSLE